MLQIKIKSSENQLFLEAKGHCGFDTDGRDIVCAAASALCMTMYQVIAENTDKLKEEPYIEKKKGYCKFVFTPQEKYKCAFINSFYTVVTGLRYIQSEFPKYIEITE